MRIYSHDHKFYLDRRENRKFRISLINLFHEVENGLRPVGDRAEILHQLSTQV
jgi:hypothetical protein